MSRVIEDIRALTQEREMISEEMRRSGGKFARLLAEDPKTVAHLIPLSMHFGVEAVDLRPEEGFAHLRYQVPVLYANFLGIIHGGIVATFLDDSAGMVASFLVGPTLRGTVSSSVVYLNPVKVGAVEVEARILKHTGSMVFVESTLISDGQLSARSNSVMAYGPPRATQ